MSVSETASGRLSGVSSFFSWGMFWLLLATIGAGLFFIDGVDALLAAWQLPEYSHGPLIPVLSTLLFLRQLKSVPVHTGALPDRWPGVALLLVALGFGALGRLSNINDLVAYATILWVGAILLISFGWSTGRHFWPPVLHLVYMLPLPGVLYYKLSTSLQFVSSELGAWFLRLLSVPVFLDGNIIDLGVFRYPFCGKEHLRFFIRKEGTRTGHAVDAKSMVLADFHRCKATDICREVDDRECHPRALSSNPISLSIFAKMNIGDLHNPSP